MSKETKHRNFDPSLCDGEMASSFRGRTNLVCFYCNKRSNIKYDGFMTKWDCTQCESTNFLDENGEITDPPVATDSTATRNLQYAIPRPNSPQPPLNSESQLFCSTCLKNQHLFTASIAQYEVELDPRDPSFRQKEKEYYAYRRRLERTYPQVCADCEPRVLNRMKEAGMTAKADHLRRMMDKSRARRAQKPSSLATINLAQTVGKILWYTGLLGQLTWSAFTLAQSAQISILSGLDKKISKSMGHLDVIIAWAVSTTWARTSIWCSVLSLWWNPMFSQMKKGFVNHIVGFGEWYKLQALMLISRSIFYSAIGSGVLADPVGTPAVGAHFVMFMSTLLLARLSQRSLRIDMSPLWQATPERLVDTAPKGQRKNPTDGESLADVLDSISNAPPTSPSRSSRNPDHSSLLSSYSTPQRAGLQQPLALQDSPGSSVAGPRPSLPSTTSGALFQSTVNGNPRTPYSAGGDEMDWTPAHASSEHRAFRSVVSPESRGRAFGESPVAEEASPFWYKVPPAPITPAQRLRNPPNQPRLRAVPSQEKENFFNNLTRKNLLQNTQDARKDAGRQDMELRPPKFFVPPPKSEVRDSLADMLTSFSLGGPDSEVPAAVENNLQFRWGHLGQFVVLALGLWFWNHSFLQVHEATENTKAVVMCVCFGIAARTVLNHWVFEAERKSQMSKVIAFLSGGLEMIFSTYTILQILTGNGNCTNCASMGTILVGGMLVQEFWYASFG